MIGIAIFLFGLVNLCEILMLQLVLKEIERLEEIVEDDFGNH